MSARPGKLDVVYAMSGKPTGHAGPGESQAQRGHVAGASGTGQSTNPGREKSLVFETMMQWNLVITRTLTKKIALFLQIVIRVLHKE